MAGQNFLFPPGPTYVPEPILNAMNRQPLDFGDERVTELVASCQADLKRLFRTKAEVFIYISNGHGSWEAVLANICDVGDRVLVPTTGFFRRVGHRWRRPSGWR